MKSRLLYLFVALTMVIGLLPGTVPVLATTAEVPAVLPMTAATTPPEVQWTQTFGGANHDYGFSVQQTLDGGYIIAGTTESFGAGWTDAYLIKTDASGNLVWSQTLGGAGDDRANSVRQTVDGGYIIAGGTSSFGNYYDVYLIKTDASGNMTWQKTFGGANEDYGYSVQPTADGGYIITGRTSSFGADYRWDVYLIKTDASGNLTWQKTFGGANDDQAYSVQPTADGGYIITGRTDSFSADYRYDVYLIKTDASGNLVWSQTFGGANDEYGLSVQPTADGGYIIAGITSSFGAGNSDVYLIKTDASGNMTWSQTFGEANNDAGYSVQPTADGGYIVAGSLTSSFGAGNSDAYLFKLGPETMAPTPPTGLTKISPDNNPLPAFKWNASANATSYEVKMDSGNWTNIGASLTYVQPTVLSKGDHTFSVRVKDASGSVSIETSLNFNVSVVADLANTKIAFSSSRDGPYEIYTMNSNGSNQTRLTFFGAEDNLPDWSPNGALIAFDSMQNSNHDIWAMNSDTTNQRRLTTNLAEDRGPAWSPDGGRIAFTSNRDGNYEIYVMNADGSNQTRLTNNTGNEMNPAWSPDGERITFWSNRDGNWEIYVMNADGSNPVRLTNNLAEDQTPVWSPDGNTIIFASIRDGNWEVYAMNADGSNQRNLTNGSAEDRFASWSPDGSTIAFVSNRNQGSYEIYQMNADGTNQQRITVNASNDEWPAWSPFLPEPTDLVSIAVMPTAPTIILGLTQQFSATGFYADNSTADLTAMATWTSSNTSVATINSSGLATALAAGTATISATSGSISGNTTLTVIIATMVTVNNGSTIKLAPGQIVSASGASGIPVAVKNLPNLGAPANGLAAFTFNFSWNPAVIRVDSVFGATAAQMAGWNIFSGTPNNTNGTVTATGFTTTYSTADVILLYLGITAVGSLGNNTTITVTITDLMDKDANPIPATPVNAPVQISLPTLLSIAVTPPNPSITVGATQQFSATGFYSDNSTADLTATATWTSSNTSVATISASGLATSLAQGTTIIRATLGSISGSTTLTVTPESTVLPGDANGDGKVNAIDITKVERIIAGLDSPTPGADANQDGNINALDITKVERIIVGLG